MFEQVELLNRILCFTPFWALIDLLLVVHFFFSWYRSAKKTKWKIDCWYLALFLTFFPSLFLLYPFNASIFNNVATMGLQYRILPYIDLAFFISVLGYLSIWIGRYLFDFTRGNFPLIVLFQLAKPICRIVENNMKSKRICLLMGISAFVMGITILTIQFNAGSLFNARGVFLSHPYLRPLFNLTVSIIPIAFSFFAARFIQFKEKIYLYFILILFIFTLFFGMRSLGLGALLGLFIQRIYYREGQCSLIKLFSVCVGLFFVAVALGQLREGSHNLNIFPIFLTKLFYGNNFSDTRDFAWILSCWDEEYLYGKTYLAALISFIPRVFSSIRSEWSISMYTNGLTGFDSDVMPGLRPGIFGESFLNFGYPGVILFGILYGFALRYGDYKIKEHVGRSKDLIKGGSYLLIFSLLSHLSISASMWSFYVFLFFNLAAIPFRGRTFNRSQRTFSQTTPNPNET